MKRPKLSRSMVLIALLSYWAIGLSNLTIVPRVYEDEPWQASTGLKLAEQGVFGSDVFSGFYNMQDRYYGYMPLHPILLSIIYRFAGGGLFQSRFETIALGLVLLVLTYSLAQRVLKDDRIGLLSIIFLLFVRTGGLTSSQTSGILLIDFARIARYDMLAAVFGLSALHAYRSARQCSAERWYSLTGFLAACATLSHLYGVFWLSVLLVLAVWDRASTLSRRSMIGSLLLGFSVPLIPYAIYVLGDVTAWRGQTSIYANRFELLNLNWYLQNLLHEPQRYGPGLGPLGLSWLLRPGFWSALIVIPSAVVFLWRRSLADQTARILIVPALSLPLLFALLIHLKLANYLLSIIPILAIVSAWGAISFWSWLRARKWVAVQVVILAILAACLSEGLWRFVALEKTASLLTPYYTFIDRVRLLIPNGTRVLGLHNYWFGLESYDYRSFVLPFMWQLSTGWSIDQGLEQIDPQVVLMDDRMREYFAADADANAQLQAWLIRHHSQWIGQVDDQTYGAIDIYRLQP
jgi:4-amino-4-deoxy-L-arabinose transferase-like glycosyltransferase